MVHKYPWEARKQYYRSRGNSVQNIKKKNIYFTKVKGKIAPSITGPALYIEYIRGRFASRGRHNGNRPGELPLKIIRDLHTSDVQRAPPEKIQGRKKLHVKNCTCGKIELATGIYLRSIFFRRNL